MARDLVVFPVGKEASADDYLAFCNANNPDVGSDWYPNDRVDAYGQRVVAYLGPTGFDWNGAPYPEPSGGPAARADGVLSSTVLWPDEE
jgi:hypothetical protein